MWRLFDTKAGLIITQIDAIKVPTIQVFVKFGLNHYWIIQGRLYLTLIIVGNMNATDISEKISKGECAIFQGTERFLCEAYVDVKEVIKNVLTKKWWILVFMELYSN